VNHERTECKRTQPAVHVQKTNGSCFRPKQLGAEQQSPNNDRGSSWAALGR